MLKNYGKQLKVTHVGCSSFKHQLFWTIIHWFTYIIKVPADIKIQRCYPKLPRCTI